MLREWLMNIIAFPFIILRSRRSCTPDPKKELKRRKANLPKALSPKRKEISFSHNQTTNQRSPLLSNLPLELRQKIYTYALRNHLIHILLTPSKIAHISCARSTPTDFARDCYPPARHRIIPHNVSLPPSDISITLLRTCRQIYAEALPILYSSNTFDIDDLSTFNFLAGNIPPTGLAAIKLLQLHWDSGHLPLEDWMAASATSAPYDDATYLLFWHTLATRMPALKELRMAITEVWWTQLLTLERPVRSFSDHYNRTRQTRCLVSRASISLGPYSSNYKCL